jgi:ATP-dependent Clp protease ATP-binding subunit ClpX
MFRKRQIPVLCSFCGKTADEAQKLVEGPGVYICAACVAVCAKIIAGEWKPPARGQRVTTFAGVYEPKPSKIEPIRGDQNA